MPVKSEVIRVVMPMDVDVHVAMHPVIEMRERFAMDFDVVLGFAMLERGTLLDVGFGVADAAME